MSMILTESELKELGFKKGGTLKVIASKDDVVVIDLNNKDVVWSNLQEFSINIGFPRIARIYKDRLELDIVSGLENDGGGRKTTLKFHFADLLLMNDTLFTINTGKCRRLK